MLWTCIERIYCPYKCSYNYCWYLSDILQCHLFLIFVRHSTVSPVPHIRQTWMSDEYEKQVTLYNVWRIWGTGDNVECLTNISNRWQRRMSDKFLIFVRHSTVSPVPDISQTFYIVTCSWYKSDILHCHLFLIFVRHSTLSPVTDIQCRMSDKYQ
jgi:hypothetical protein